MSTLKYNQWLNTDNTENYKCRAWVNFNGTGTVAIRASGNVSSITDNGTGDYTVNFTAAMSDANYALSGSGDENADSPYVWLLSKTASGVRVKIGRYGTNLGDPLNGSVAIFR
jgi:lipocalin